MTSAPLKRTAAAMPAPTIAFAWKPARDNAIRSARLESPKHGVQLDSLRQKPGKSPVSRHDRSSPTTGACRGSLLSKPPSLTAQGSLCLLSLLLASPRENTVGKRYNQLSDEDDLALTQ